MPVATIGFTLKPVGFFDRNPALDVPPSQPHAGSCIKRGRPHERSRGPRRTGDRSDQRHRRRDGAGTGRGRRASSRSRRAAATTSGIEGALASACDVRDLAQIEALVAACVERFGGLDILVANAGVGAYGDFLDLEARVARRDDRHQREGLPAHDPRRAAAAARELVRRPGGRHVDRRPARAGGRGGVRGVEARADRLHALARPRALPPRACAARSSRPAVSRPAFAMGRGRTPEDPTWPGCCGRRRWPTPSCYARHRPRTGRGSSEASILRWPTTRWAERKEHTWGNKVTIIGGGSSSFVPLLLRRLIQSGLLGDSTVTLDGHRRAPARRDAGARRQADRGRGQRAHGAKHARPARVARRRRLRHRRDLGRRLRRLGRRPRDPRALRPRHARRRLGRPRRHHARLPERAGARGGGSERGRGGARRVRLQLHEPGPDRGARDARRGTGGAELRALLVHGPSRAAPSGWRSRRASSRARSRCRRWWRASTTARP